MTTTIANATVEQYGDMEVITFPSGDCVAYRDSDHSYWRECKPKPRNNGYSGSGRLTGVSTLCGPYDFRPDPLLRWVERLTLDGVVRGFNGERIPSDPHMLRQMLQTRGLRWEQIRDEAGDAGTNLHSIILEALGRGTVPSVDDVPEDQRAKAQGFLKWWLDREPEVTHVEQVVASLTHGFAGRLDLRCTIKDPLRPDPLIVDLKTGGFISSKALVQPAGYSLGGMESGLWDEPAQGLIVQVTDSGDYREIWSPATHDSFLRALAIYRESAELAKVAKAA